MTLADVYLFCFVIGFLFSAVALMVGQLDLNLSDGTGHDFDVTHDGSAPHSGGTSHQVSPLNLGTAAAFLAWFGGTGLPGDEVLPPVVCFDSAGCGRSR